MPTPQTSETEDILSLKNLKKEFYSILHENGFPETSLEIIKAQKQMEYLGMYSSGSQFRSIPKIYIHIENNIKAAEETYQLADAPSQIKYSQQTVMDTLTHEYMHSVYEFLKESNPTTFDTLKYFDDEEDFVETAALFITRGSYKEIIQGREKPFCDEDEIIVNALETFKNSMFYPEDVADCQNANSIYKVIQKCIENIDVKYQSEEGEYIEKVHDTFNKHAVEHFSKCFKNKIELVYIQNQLSNNYSIIAIHTNNPDNLNEKIYIDNTGINSQFTPNKTVYTEEEIAPFMLKPKTPKIK